MTAIIIENLIKNYHNGVQALNGLSFTVQEGGFFSLLGENGAGKSTLINILTTYLRPTSGKVMILEKDIYNEASEIRPKIACVAQKISIDTYLSLTENMMFQGSLYKIPKEEAKKRMNHLIACFGLEQYLNYPVVSYSGGIKRRLDIALNMMSRPKILFLDEPTVGMDITSRRAMWDMMKKIRDDFGTTIFLTTHYLEEADCLSDTVCIMKDGKEVVYGSPDSLRKYLHQDILKISFEDKESANKGIQNLNVIFTDRTAALRGENIFIPIINRQKDLSQAAQCLFNQHIALMGIQIMQPTMEEIFIQMTSREEGCE